MTTDREEFVWPDTFAPETREWFSQSFADPTLAQQQAWHAIADGKNTLVIAPTGSGKTLAAFLSAINDILVQPHAGDPKQRTRVLYLSPLRALASDVERNLASPLVGINRVRGTHGLDPVDVTIDVRTSDTTPAERQRQARRPADILITTPESLFLLLTSRARETLAGIQTVIVDEVHAVAGTKRGAHLAVSLERLDVLLTKPAQRIGLSATVEPASNVARYLGGHQPVHIVAPKIDKQLEITVEVPVEDLAAPTGSQGDEDGAARNPSIWPHVESRILELIRQNRSTLIFANSRRIAERLTARLNELAAEQATTNQPPPAEIMAQAGQTYGAPATVARAHHGSVSRDQRAEIEHLLKSGQLPAVVATSSLELGIDMGSVDLVIQLEAPPSVASGLQRTGRAGHQVGEVSRAVVFPKHRGDLLTASVVTQLMQDRQMESTELVTNPLDVLAQHIVSMTSVVDSVSADELFRVIRRAAGFNSLSRQLFDAVLDMLAGRYPSDDFSTLKPRIVWDRISDTITTRPGSQRLAVTSGGTIPDRGLFGVFLVGDQPTRVGELDEEMVYESRVGDVFALGTSSWQIVDITPDRVLVTAAPGRPGKVPFWHGDALGRPPETGAAIGRFLRQFENLGVEATRQQLGRSGLDEWATDNLLGYLTEQQAATTALPTDRRFIIEQFRDEIGDWRIILHTPLGARIHAPWALAISATLATLSDLDAQVMHSDDGIVLRIPDTDDDAAIQTAISAIFVDPEEVSEIVTNAIGSSALFASRFRECAARALLLPRRDPGKRTPLWQQRQRSAQLLTVASRYPDFPIVLEAVRECLTDVYDLPRLTETLTAIRDRKVSVEHQVTGTPSPFARTLLFNYVAAFIYEGDSPLAERRAAALSLDPELMGELLGTRELRELFSEEAIAEVSRRVELRDPDRAPTNPEQTADLLRMLGPLSEQDAAARGVQPQWLAELVAAKRVISVGIAGEPRFVAIEDAGRLRDGLGVGLPPGIPQAFLEPVPTALVDLVGRYARTHGPFSSEELAASFGLSIGSATAALELLRADDRVVHGEFSPGGSTTQWCDANVLRRIRRATIAALRQEVEPVPPQTLAAFLPRWQHVSKPLSGVDGLYEVIDQLAGLPIAASVLESAVFPARIRDYQPAMIDELLATGDVTWTGHGALSNRDGWLTLTTSETPGLLPEQQAASDDRMEAILDVMHAGGAWRASELADRLGMNTSDLETALWSLVWSAHITCDSFAPVRAHLTSSKRTRRPHSVAPVGAGSRRRGLRRANLRGRASDLGSAIAVGRWSMTPNNPAPDTTELLSRAQSLLRRYGVVSRAHVATESIPGGFAAVYRTFASMEDMGHVRRGYFIEGLGAAQFATSGVVDLLREDAQTHAADTIGRTTSPPLILAATDPANPFGASVAWPATVSETSHKPSRAVGAWVISVDGTLAIYLERGGKTCLTFTTNDSLLARAIAALAAHVSAGRTPRIAISNVNAEGLEVSAQRTLFEENGFVFTPKGLVVRRH